MKTLNVLCVSFFLAINLFLTAVWIWPVDASIQRHEELIQGEGIISKTADLGYPKHLDAFYFYLGSLLIPVTSFVFWWLIVKRQSWLLPIWVIALAWFILVVSSTVGGLSQEPPQ